MGVEQLAGQWPCKKSRISRVYAIAQPGDTLLSSRDVSTAAGLLDWMSALEFTCPAIESNMSDPATAGGTAPIPPTADELTKAYKAFKKRLKLTQLDDASRIGRGPMSSGSGSSILGITPPDQYGREVWEALVSQGKLKRAGQGMYSLA